MRPPSSVWIWRKEMEWFSVAFTSLIGMLTRPNEMAPFHMDRTCSTLSIGLCRSSGGFGGFSSYDAYHGGGGETSRPQQPGKGAVSRHRVHQGRGAALLRH